MIKHARQLILFASLLCLTGCGVDEFRNLQRKSREECEKAGGRPITDRFCNLNPDAGVLKDAAVRDASDDDAGPDDEDAGSTGCVEEEERACYTQSKATSQQPPCKPGISVCRGGVFGDCEDEVTPKDESCNGEDDDCDGTVDEIPSNKPACDVGGGLLGECALGVEVCDDGKAKCLQSNAPQSDVCDGRDNDCDGEIDEGTAVSCYPDDAIGCTKNEAGEYECVGTCRAGTRSCKEGAYEEQCAGERVGPADGDVCPELGETSGDEDCDGKVDEGCGCSDGAVCYTGPSGTMDVGPCHAGTWTCSDATHGTCTGELVPQPETCGNPGEDNDCDGMVDDIPMINTSCSSETTTMGVCKANATWQCREGVRTCVPGAMGAEVCDAQNTDENCNGIANEGFDLNTEEENCGACGVVCAPGLQCCGGRCVNTQTSNAHCSICGNECAPGQTCCGGGCVNTLNNVMHCGSCNRACTQGLLPGCKNGACTKVL